jgi:biopolymer transport protein ExbD
MSKFISTKKDSSPGISTASLPDIVFMLLFFFMVTTKMRDQELIVQVAPPSATEVTKMENKSLVDFIIVGPPFDERYGTEPRIQLDDSFARVEDIGEFISQRKEAREEAVRSLVTTSLKVDKNTRMGLVTDIKQELRHIGALKIVYSTNQGPRRH